MDCYKEYLENAGGQLQGQNPPAYTRGLLKAKQVLKPPTSHCFSVTLTAIGAFGECAVCHTMLFGVQCKYRVTNLLNASAYRFVLEESQLTNATAVPDCHNSS
jgi:hypothetical protein